MLNSTLFKLSAQVHHFAGPEFSIDVVFEPSFHFIENDGGVLGVSELVVLETESQEGFFSVLNLNLKIDLDGPLGHWASR